jgi:hypothetical protein
MTQDDNRDTNGRWQKGHSANAGGLTRSQKRIERMLEGLDEEAVNRLRELMHSPDESIALGAVKEYLHRVAPPPPKAAPVAVNVALNDLRSEQEAHLAALRRRIEARRATQAAAVLDVTPDAATVAALPAPKGEED